MSTRKLTSTEVYDENNIGKYLPKAEADFLIWKSTLEANSSNNRNSTEDDEVQERDTLSLRCAEIFPESLCSDREIEETVGDEVVALARYPGLDPETDGKEREGDSSHGNFMKRKSKSTAETKGRWQEKSAIEEVIPKNGFVATVMDRKVNFGMLPSDVSHRTLLEAWVEDNPHRTYRSDRKSLLEYSTMDNSASQKVVRRDIQPVDHGNPNEQLIDLLQWLKMPSSQRTKRLFSKERRAAYLERKRKERAKLQAKRNQARRSLRSRGIII